MSLRLLVMVLSMVTLATLGCDPATTPLDVPSSDAGLDAPGRDAPGLDAPGLDAPGLDAPELDAPGLDAPDLDAPGLDAPPTDAGEATPDAGIDAGTDAGSDAGRDAGSDAGRDAGSDAGTDAGRDAGSDAGRDAGSDAGRDAGTDAGTDAGCTIRTCYADVDGDTYRVGFAVCGTCPSGTVTDYSGALDCNDGSADARPGQTAFFTTGYPFGEVVSYDYDCDGLDEPRFLQMASASTCTSATTFAACGLASGWRTAVPMCGDTAEYLACAWSGTACYDGPTTGPLQQSCQ